MKLAHQGFNKRLNFVDEGALSSLKIENVSSRLQMTGTERKLFYTIFNTDKLSLPFLLVFYF